MVRTRQFSFCTLFAICLLLSVFTAFAQEDIDTPLLGPLNSDPLTERGISPRVLDIALFSHVAGSCIRNAGGLPGNWHTW